MSPDRGPSRFFDTRAAYMLFATATSEKAAVAERVGGELPRITPQPPGLRVFDAGIGDASVLSQVMREMHEVFPHIPWLVAGKEISLEDVRQAVSRLPDRLFEHPETVVAVTNMPFAQATNLRPDDDRNLVWREVALTGSTSHGFAAQINALLPRLARDWEVRTSERTGNPVPVCPTVLILYRADHEFILRPIVPRRDDSGIEFDLVIAAQAYRAASDLERKVANVISPLARSLAPGGRLIGIHAKGEDPGMEIIRRIWPGENPFPHNAADIVDEARRQLAATDLEFAQPDPNDVVRYEMHTMPSESAENIGTSSVLATWNAAAYVAQIDEARLSEAIRSGAWEAATRAVMQDHPTVWFENEVYLITRPAARFAPAVG